MDAQNKSALAEAGVNVDSALERFMGNEKMLLKYLNRFLEEKSYASLLEAVQKDDAEGAIGCTGMHEMVVEQEKAMRAGNWQQAKDMMPAIEKTYDSICVALRANLPA